jgi:putative transposase
MSQQLSFIKKPKLTHGGSSTKGHARTARPLCTKRPIHLVMRASCATGSKSFLAPAFKTKIEIVLQRQAAVFGVKIYDFANGGNHFHLIVKIFSHSGFKNFLRAVSGLIARLVSGAQKGRAIGKKFWDARPFTRVAAWGKAYEYLKSYLTLNKLEAMGFIAHQPRTHKRRKLMSVSIDPISVNYG